MSDYNRVVEFVDRWMPDGPDAIEFGRDFSAAISEISRTAYLIGVHKGDQMLAKSEEEKQKKKFMPDLIDKCLFWFLVGLTVGLMANGFLQGIESKESEHESGTKNLQVRASQSGRTSTAPERSEGVTERVQAEVRH